jgi:hypothetical protein
MLNRVNLVQLINKLSMKILKIIITLTSLTVPMFSLAAGIQVSPARMDFSVSGQKPATQNITVVNPTADVQIFEVYADDFANIITAKPSSFTLESGSKKTVSITVNPSGIKDNIGQKFSTNISIVGKPLADNKFSVGTGVKIPLSAIFSQTSAASTSKNRPILLCLLLLTFITLVYFLHSKKS